MAVSTPDKVHMHQAISDSHPTRLALWFNALTCTVFGWVFVCFAPEVSTFLGAIPEDWLRIVGGGLLIHAVHLTLSSMRKTLRSIEIYYFSASDMLWFMGSLILLTETNLITTLYGTFSFLVVAIVVGTIGVAQLWTFAVPTRKNIGRSG